MPEHRLIEFSSVLVLGIVAQWIAWRFRLPSILLLLVFGFIAGPVAQLIDTNQLMGELLLPVVSVSVAIILFEGGMSLKISELREVGATVRNLISVGALVTWVLASAAAIFILGLQRNVAVLLGAILVVTGPTVIGPLLTHVRPTNRVRSILKWEGILIDPIGALLAVLVYETILAKEVESATILVALGIVKTVAIGSLLGGFAALVMIALLKYHLVPDFLENVVTLMLVVAAYTTSNFFQRESGLLAATVMGIALANQRLVVTRHILEFKENLRVLLISSLFILLAARLKLEDLTSLNKADFVFLALLFLVVRPVAVALSTRKSGINWREKLFLSWMAPRGIVAAAVASIFAFGLIEAGQADAERLVPLTFLVIIGTVAVYGLTAVPVARWLRVAQPTPDGILIVGAHPWAVSIAEALRKLKFQVVLVDTNEQNIDAARAKGLSAFLGNILSEEAWDEIELDGIGRLFALTSNDEVNSLSALHFSRLLGRAAVFQLPPKGTKRSLERIVSRPLRGRLMFGENVTHGHLTDRFNRGARIELILLTREKNFAALQKAYGDAMAPLFLATEARDLIVYTRRDPPRPREGQTLVCLLDVKAGQASPQI